MALPWMTTSNYRNTLTDLESIIVDPSSNEVTVEVFIAS